MISALDVRDVTVSYGRQAAVDRVTFNVNEGEILGIVGPNGAGKTSLFRAILGLEPYNGTIRLFEYDHAKVGALIPLIGYVPQKISFEPNFPASVYDVVSMGAIPNKKVVAGAKIIQQCGCCWNRIYANMSKIEDRIMAALDTVGLIHLKDRRIGELSGRRNAARFYCKMPGKGSADAYTGRACGQRGRGRAGKILQRDKKNKFRKRHHHNLVVPRP